MCAYLHVHGVSVTWSACRELHHSVPEAQGSWVTCEPACPSSMHNAEPYALIPAPARHEAMAIPHAFTIFQDLRHAAPSAKTPDLADSGSSWGPAEHQGVLLLRQRSQRLLLGRVYVELVGLHQAPLLCLLYSQGSFLDSQICSRGWCQVRSWACWHGQSHGQAILQALLAGPDQVYSGEVKTGPDGSEWCHLQPQSHTDKLEPSNHSFH